MIIWVDADACPRQIREIITKAARRLSVQTIFVANKPLALPELELFKFVQVGSGPDVADKYIVDNANDGDLVVTEDIALAALLLPKGVVVISPRGQSFNADNIGERMAGRALMQGLRDAGELTGGPRPFDDKLKQQFASRFDAALHKLLKKAQTDSERS